MSFEKPISGMTDRGFTLIEVVFVVAVIGVLSSIAIPAFMKWLPNMRLKAAVTDLRGTLQETRFEAIKQNTAYGVGFNAANNEYTVYSGPGPDNDWADLSDNPPVSTFSLDSYGSGVSFGNGNATANASNGGAVFPASGVVFSPVANAAVFNSRGMGEAGCSGWLYMTHKENSTTYAIGMQASGVILVRKWSGGTWQ